MFSDVQNVSVQDGKFMMTQNNYNYSANARGMESLKGAVSIGAFHNSDERFDPPKCHSRTREAVLARIMQWARREIDADKLIMWIHGAAGTGKSAIEQSIAEMCDALEGGVLIASFFFSRNDGSRNHSKAFVATIVYQMTVTTPALRPHIETALEIDPLLLKKSLDVQVTRLIIQPVQKLLVQGEVVGPYLLLVDGLDECMDDTRIQLIEEIQRLVDTFSHASLFIASFASRPEPDIKNTFLYASVSDIVTRIALDDDYQADDDIRLFLSDKFAAIQRTRPRIPKTWPTPAQLEELVSKASGQFIYASTVHKFVSSPQHSPTKRLDIVLGLAPAQKASPFSQLDALYRQILLSVPPDCVEDGIRTVVCVHVMAAVSSDVNAFAVGQILEIDEEDLMMHMDNYACIIAREDYGPVRPLHASLGDFLFDSERAQELYRDPRVEHTYVLERAIKYLSSWDGFITRENAGLLTYTLLNSPSHLRHFPITTSLLEHLHLVFQSSLFSVMIKPPPRSSWSLTYRVYLTLSFLDTLLHINVDGIPSEFKENCINMSTRLMAAYMAEADPKSTRILKSVCICFTGDAQEMRFLGNPILTLFPDTEIAFYMHSMRWHLRAYWSGNSSIPETHRFLDSSEYHSLAVHCLLYLRQHVVPRTAPKQLSTYEKVPQYRPSFSLPNKNFPKISPVFTSLWPQYPTDANPFAQGDWTHSGATSVVGGAQMAFKLLPFLLKHAPASYRLLRLCQQPNLKLFPWVACPKLAPSAVKAMARYRRRFTLRRSLCHDEGLHLSIPLDTDVKAIIDRTHQLEM